MTASTSSHLPQIRALLAEKGYEVSDSGPDTLRIRETESGIAIQAVLEGDILYFSLVCTTVPKASITPELTWRMLDAGNGISTSYFQLYDAGDGRVAVTLNNFCKLQDLGVDDEDDVLSCIHFLLVDVFSARRLLGDLKA
jgi:hypothetical protein